MVVALIYVNELAGILYVPVVCALRFISKYCSDAPEPFVAKILVAPALKLLYHAESAVNAAPLMVQVKERAAVGLGVGVVIVVVALSFLQEIKVLEIKSITSNFLINII